MNTEAMRQFFKENITYKDWTFYVGESNGTPYLQIWFNAPDNFSGNVETQHCRKWQLSQWMTTTELVQTAWAAVKRAELHEAAEQFKYKGADIFNTHLDVDGLRFLCMKNCYEHRGDAPPTEKVIGKL